MPGAGRLAAGQLGQGLRRLGSSKALSPEAGLPNSSIAIASSCGSVGTEVMAMAGARAVPVMATLMVVRLHRGGGDEVERRVDAVDVD